MAFASEVGTVLGPWTEDNTYHVARIMDTQMRPDSMSASHILISYSGAYGAPETVTRTKIGARQLADSLLNVANTADFIQLANEFSDDPSVKENSGDLGWFADGQMVPEFNQACIDNNVNDIVVIETNFGFHVIQITGKKDDSKKIRIAQINLPITYSKETHNLAFTEATHFASGVSDIASFDSVSTNAQLNVMKGDFIKEMEANIMGIPASRSIVRWMFGKEVTTGTVSDVFDFDNQIVVAIVSNVRAAGISPLEDVKEFIKPLVVREVKAKQLIAKLAGSKDINTFATSNNVAIETADALTFNTYSLPKYGPEQNVQGRMFNVDANKAVGPIKGDQGVYIFSVIDKGAVPEKQDLKNYQDRSYSTFGQRVNTSAYQALEENATIDNFLYFFY
jgi:parvulin-like peptidyl-prolyl isomerase